MTLRIIRGYRTISYDEATVLALFPPCDILADMDTKVNDFVLSVGMTKSQRRIMSSEYYGGTHIRKLY